MNPIDPGRPARRKRGSRRARPVITTYTRGLDMSDEYPRPQLERSSFIDLCGPWEYAITGSPRRPRSWNGEILVPFSPEARASGVGRTLLPGQYLWYRREVTFPPEGERVLLQFGAVDQIAVVWCNGREVGSHYGGYAPFTADLTDALRGDRHAELIVAVQDDSENSALGHGKQRLKRGGSWYTAQSGIWQPVWAECVPDTYIRSLHITPHFDDSSVEISADPGGVVHFQGKDYPCPARIPVPNFIPWTPETPHLYHFTVTCGADEVKSYFAMRKFSVENARLCLNGAPYFHNGVLDQGYNPEGLYTWPSDEAMLRDITLAKSMGFNTIRKHMKTEPARWYYHCDRLGMLVWQDIPCGGGPYSPLAVGPALLSGRSMRDSSYRRFGREDPVGRQRFLHEIGEIVTTLRNCPCIALWTLFHEGWGQFDAARTAQYVFDLLDDTRTIDHASGWHDQGVGPVRSDHALFRRYRFQSDRLGRAVILSSFGGYNLRIWSHMWNEKDFGFNSCVDAKDLEKQLRELYAGQVAPARKAGLSAAVYTQLTDVEDELNGLITYDREVVKIDPDTVRRIIRTEAADR